MSPQTINTVDEIDLFGPISTAMLRNLARATAIGKLFLARAKGAPYPGQKVTEAIAQGLAGIHALNRLWLWFDITPAALRHVFAKHLAEFKKRGITVRQ